MNYNLEGELRMVGTLPLDSTLTLVNAAAQSKAAGDAIKAVKERAIAHEENTENPHNITKAQLGLGNVDDTADKDKPVSTATAEAIKKAVDDLKAESDVSIGNVQTAADKAQAAAESAQEAANNAQTAANNAQSAADSTVSTAKIADQAVTNAKIATGAVTVGKIAGGAVSLAKLGSDVTAEALGGVVSDLLWTNASASSSFAAQTISKNLTGYSRVLVCFNREDGIARRVTEETRVGASAIAQLTALSNGSAAIGYNRVFSATTTGITFEAGLTQRLNTTTRTEDNTVLVPTHIYGIKGDA